jgi:hypothetical protein
LEDLAADRDSKTNREPAGFPPLVVLVLVLVLGLGLGRDHHPVVHDLTTR